VILTGGEFTCITSMSGSSHRSGSGTLTDASRRLDSDAGGDFLAFPCGDPLRTPTLGARALARVPQWSFRFRCASSVMKTTGRQSLCRRSMAAPFKPPHRSY
jgi:hypothetical protein